ncbi:MAG TPA: MurT ligase domain-containing protein, partial [Candidatus Saccharimonadales bacterium]|nr:MurT ligase domain-containing protein [Candidatus Saccharimonadales bacterium]
LTSGTRAADMALRLSYDDVAVARIQPKLDTALRDFCVQTTNNKLIFTTYTAMLVLYKMLKKEVL